MTIDAVFARIAASVVRASSWLDEGFVAVGKTIDRDRFATIALLVFAGLCAVVDFDIAFAAFARHHVTSTALSNFFASLTFSAVAFGSVARGRALRTAAGAREARLAASRRAALPWMIAGAAASIACAVAESLVRPDRDWVMPAVLWGVGGLVLCGSVVATSRAQAARDLDHLSRTSS